MSETLLAGRYKVVTEDLNQLVKDAQLLFAEATTLTGEKANEAIFRGMELLEQGKVKLQSVQNSVLETGKEMSASTDHYVHENPWRAIGIAASVGFVVGYFGARRCK